MVLNDLILDHAHARFFDGEFGQRDAHPIGSGSGGKKNAIHLLLCVLSKSPLSSAAPSQRISQIVGIDNLCVYFFHNHHPSTVFISKNLLI